MPKLSVIIPIYNGSKYITKLLVSIIKKNNSFLSDLEIVLVDDGSTDNSFEICQYYSKKYSFIHVYKKSNGGIASARNWGLVNAHGDYVTFCDQDDYLIHGYQRFIERIESVQCDVLISNFYVEETGRILSKGLISSDKVYKRSDIEKILLLFIGEGELLKPDELSTYNLPEIPLTIWNGIYKKKLIDENNVRFLRFVDYEDDWLFIISVLFVAKHLCVTPDAFYCWSINPKSESHTRKFIPDFIQKRKNLYEWVDRIVYQLPVSKDRICKYQEKVKNQTVLWSFYNSCNLTLPEYVGEMKYMERIYRKEIDYNFKIGRLGKFYLFLLKYKKYRLAYYINNITFRKSYH